MSVFARRWHVEIQRRAAPCRPRSTRTATFPTPCDTVLGWCAQLHGQIWFAVRRPGVMGGPSGVALRVLWRSAASCRIPPLHQ